jgi:O-acetyl-ADP-ribose deacetylase (regulator of RNase III)
MSIKIVKGDLLEAFDRQEVNFIAHCCNMQNVMGAGIARSIKERYPSAFEADKEWYDKRIVKGFKEPQFSFCRLRGTTKHIFNLYGQNSYGVGYRQLDYGLFARALFDWDRLIRNYPITQEGDLEIGLPYGIGCGLAGGDWVVVHELIREILKNYNVTIYKLE